jgi:hypothetical protein
MSYRHSRDGNISNSSSKSDFDLPVGDEVTV